MPRFSASVIVLLAFAAFAGATDSVDATSRLIGGASAVNDHMKSGRRRAG
jgi:hypothetical protein